MKLHEKYFLVLTLLFALLVLNPLPVLAEAILSIQPTVSTPTVGSTFNVFVDISNVTDLYAYQFDINYNAADISAVSITEDAFLSSGGTTYFIPGSIDNTGGSISFTADSLIGAISGVNGSGILADITFHDLTGSTSLIDISNIMLLDSTLSNISYSSVGGTVAPVPEPTTMMLLGTGLLGLVGFRKKIKK